MLGQGRLRVLGNKKISGEEPTGAHIRQEGEVCYCPFSKYMGLQYSFLHSRNKEGD